MKLKNIPTLLITSSAMALCANAAVVRINQLGFNTNGVAFDATNEANASDELFNGAAPTGSNIEGTSIDATLTYNNLDLDGDASANDSVTLTINVATPGPGLLFNQGFHTNWGTLEGMVITVGAVSGTTTDTGDLIVFDGFVGAAIGAGNGAVDGVDKSVDINGTTASVSGPATGGYVFLQDYLDFDPVASLSYTNSLSNSGGTLVARNFDLQFSTTPIPEPSSLAMIGLAGGLLSLRRRK